MKFIKVSITFPTFVMNCKAGSLEGVITGSEIQPKFVIFRHKWPYNAYLHVELAFQIKCGTMTVLKKRFGPKFR